MLDPNKIEGVNMNVSRLQISLELGLRANERGYFMDKNVLTKETSRKRKKTLDRAWQCKVAMKSGCVANIGQIGGV